MAMGENFNDKDQQMAIEACLCIFASSSPEFKQISDEERRTIVNLIYNNNWSELFKNLVWFEYLKQAHINKFMWKCISEKLVELNQLFPEKSCLFVKN